MRATVQPDEHDTFTLFQVVFDEDPRVVLLPAYRTNAEAMAFASGFNTAVEWAIDSIRMAEQQAVNERDARRRKEKRLIL